jgi:hypothetical protein
MLDFLDDKAGKPVAINKFIGRRPTFAFGNSEGDLQMLQWTASGSGQRFIGIVHHPDAEREWNYDRYSLSAGWIKRSTRRFRKDGPWWT